MPGRTSRAGVLTGGVYQTLSGGTLVLNTGATITTIGATVEVSGSTTPSGSGDIESDNPGTASLMPLQQTLQTILSSGRLVIQTYQTVAGPQATRVHHQPGAE